MYCTKCGQPIDDKAVMCVHCGYQFVQPPKKPEDKPSTAFAVLGFFLPIVGLILLLVYHDEKPKAAKSAGKGALAGFITGIVISIIFVILFTVIGFSAINHTVDNFDTYEDRFEQFYEDHSQLFTEEDVSQYVDIEIGELLITENTYYIESTLHVTVTNNHEEMCSYIITLEAIDENGNRISTDMIYADRLTCGQSVELEAFSYIMADDLEDYENATFRVLDISQTVH